MMEWLQIIAIICLAITTMIHTHQIDELQKKVDKL